MNLQDISRKLNNRHIKHTVVAMSKSHEAFQTFKKKPTLENLKGYLLSDAIKPASIHVENTSIFIVLNNLTATIKVDDSNDGNVSYVVKRRNGKKLFAETQSGAFGFADALRSLDKALEFFLG